MPICFSCMKENFEIRMTFESGKDFGDEVDQRSTEILLSDEVESENEIGELFDEVSGVFEIF